MRTCPLAAARTTTPFHTGAPIRRTTTVWPRPTAADVPGLYRGRPIRRRLAGAQRVRAVRRARQRGRDGGGLLRRRPERKRLYLARGARRLLGSAPRLVRSAYRSWCAPANAVQRASASGCRQARRRWGRDSPGPGRSALRKRARLRRAHVRQGRGLGAEQQQLLVVHVTTGVASGTRHVGPRSARRSLARRSRSGRLATRLPAAGKPPAS